MSYVPGCVKRDPSTGFTATRTGFEDEEPYKIHAWLVCTMTAGAVWKTTEDVLSWEDIYTPPIHVESSRPQEIEA